MCVLPAVLAVLLAGCSSQPPALISLDPVAGTALCYARPGDDASYQAEFHVKVTIHNTGRGPLTGSRSMRFFAKGGLPLNLLVCACDPANVTDATPPGGSREQNRAGTLQSFEFGTCKHTVELYQGVRGEPMQFSIAILLNGLAIEGLYLAVLPRIEKLPRWALHSRLAASLATRLQFAALGTGAWRRFLMSTMMAAAGYAWTVIPLSERKTYITRLKKRM